MARVVPEIENKPIIGRQIFDIVTSGMYDNPLMIYREYIQNSVDSIDLATATGLISHEDAKISITLNGHDRSIVIEDNGQGIDNYTAHGILTNLGCSPKEGTNQRGFRGIGRLGGLAYCDELIFETKAVSDEFVSVVRWNRKEFDTISSNEKKDITLAEMIQAVADLDYAELEDETPTHFFRVTLKNVHRFHADMLMNLKAVNDYLAQCSPVPFNCQAFSHSAEIESYLARTLDYKCYQIWINGRQIFRPYSDAIKLSVNNSDKIQSIEFFEFTDINSELIALGWYAKTNFLATLPTALNIKGIRVRQGNIEVGGEHFLDDKFSEPRFSGWQIGEIHIVNKALKPNARRDGFEHTASFEKFLEQSHALGRHLSRICRKSSNVRIASSKTVNYINKLDKLVNDPLTYIDGDHYQKTRDVIERILCEVDKTVVKGISDDVMQRLIEVKNKISEYNNPMLLDHVLDVKKLTSFDQKGLLKHIAKTIICMPSKIYSQEDILQVIINDFIKADYGEYKLKGLDVCMD